MKFQFNQRRNLGRKIYWASGSDLECPTQSAPLQADEMRVSTDLNALMDVLTWFDQFNHPPIPFQIWLQCQLALAEGFTNAVRHAHHGQTDLPIVLEVAVFSDRLEMRIWDQGAPFDLHRTLAALPGQVDAAAEGGRGLKLMQRIADSLSYARTADSRNCLYIVKQYVAAS